MENNKRWDIKWDIKTTHMWAKFFLNSYSYFARTSRYNVNKINFMQPKENACKTMQILVVSIIKKHIYVISKISWLHWFLSWSLPWVLQKWFVPKNVQKCLKRGNSNKNNGKQYDWPRMLLCYTLCYDQCTVQTVN